MALNGIWGVTWGQEGHNNKGQADKNIRSNGAPFREYDLLGKRPIKAMAV